MSDPCECEGVAVYFILSLIFIVMMSLLRCVDSKHLLCVDSKNNSLLSLMVNRDSPGFAREVRDIVQPQVTIPYVHYNCTNHEQSLIISKTARLLLSVF